MIIDDNNLIELHKCYSEKHRFYHNMNHISNMIENLNLISQGVKIKNWQLLAIYYHDSIYDVRNKDNEEQSMRLFGKHYYNSYAITPEEYHLINTTILSTKYYFSELYKDEYDYEVLKVLDSDLGSLGTDDLDVFIYNNENIKKENVLYFSEKEVKSGTINFCKKMLKKEFIYNTIVARNLWEQNARKNLKYLIERNS